MFRFALLVVCVLLTVELSYTYVVPPPQEACLTPQTTPEISRRPIVVVPGGTSAQLFASIDVQHFEAIPQSCINLWANINGSTYPTRCGSRSTVAEVGVSDVVCAVVQAAREQGIEVGPDLEMHTLGDRNSEELWLNSVLLHPSFFLDEACAYDLMLRTVVTNAGTTDFQLPTGLYISAPNFTQVAYAPFYDVLGALMVSLGWQRGVNFFNAWYDTSFSPMGLSTLGSPGPTYFDRLFDLVSGFEGTLLVSVSAGCFYGYWFLVYYDGTNNPWDPNWKSEHIYQWVLLSSSMSGLVGLPTLQWMMSQNTQDEVYPILNGWQSWSGLAVLMNEAGSWAWPDPNIYQGTTLWQISWNGGSNYEYNAGQAATVRQALGISGRFATIAGAPQRPSDFGLYHPGVASISFCGTNVNTSIGWNFEITNNGQNVTATGVYSMAGDGMFGDAACAYYPRQWQNAGPISPPKINPPTLIQMINGVDHLGMLEDVVVLLSWLPDVAMNLPNHIQLTG